MKALLVELGIPTPRTHDLDRLLMALVPTHPQLQSLRRGLLFLTEFAVEARYPGLNTSKRQTTPTASHARHEFVVILISLQQARHQHMIHEFIPSLDNLTR